MRARAVVLVLAVLGGLAGTAVPASATGHVTVGPNVNISRVATSQTESAVAIDPSDSRNAFAFANHEGAGAGSGMFGAFTTDGGTTWTGRVIGDGVTDTLPVACCDPAVAWDEFGNLFIAYVNGNLATVELALSTDGGQTFALLNTFSPISSTANGVDQPNVAAAEGAVWVSWVDVRRGAGGAVLGVVASGASVTGQGAANVGAFSAAQTAPGSGNSNYPDIAIGPAGQVMVTYQSPPGGQAPGTIFTNTDGDGLAAGGFGAQVNVAATNVGGFDAIPPQPDRTIDAEAGVAYDRSGGPFDGRAYLIYTDEPVDEGNDTNVMLRVSDDDGTTWGPPLQVNDDGGTNEQFLPQVSLDQTTGFVAVTFHDSRADDGAGGAGDTDGIANTDAQFWGAVSTDGGASFLPNFQISAGTSNESGSDGPPPGLVDIDFGDYSGADFHDGLLLGTWADNSNSTGDNPDGTLTRLDLYTAPVTVQQDQAPTADAGPDVAGDEGSAIPLNGTASDPEGSPLAVSWSVTPVAGVDAGATCAFDPPDALATEITCTDDGTFDATLTVDDGTSQASDTARVTVGNVPPAAAVASPSEGALFQVNAPVSLSVGVTDRGTNDSHDCFVDWDDGTSTSFPAAGGACAEVHTFSSAGVYTIETSVSDDDGGVGSATVMVVVFDPTAGFVTGGGWIHSPAGAYTADPTAEGRATFGFVSRYHKGASVPSGETEFAFTAGRLNFHSDSYQWLVVAGAKAQYKGTGTVNGLGGFGFLLTATDGQQPGGGGTDRFRIKIWESVSGAVIYDNAPSLSDDIDSVSPQAIGGGSIVIHKK